MNKHKPTSVTLYLFPTEFTESNIIFGNQFSQERQVLAMSNIKAVFQELFYYVKAVENDRFISSKN